MGLGGDGVAGLTGQGWFGVAGRAGRRRGWGDSDHRMGSPGGGPGW